MTLCTLNTTTIGWRKSNRVDREQLGKNNNLKQGQRRTGRQTQHCTAARPHGSQISVSRLSFVSNSSPQHQIDIAAAAAAAAPGAAVLLLICQALVLVAINCVQFFF